MSKKSQFHKRTRYIERDKTSWTYSRVLIFPRFLYRGWKAASACRSYWITVLRTRDFFFYWTFMLVMNSKWAPTTYQLFSSVQPFKVIFISDQWFSLGSQFKNPVMWIRIDCMRIHKIWLMRIQIQIRFQGNKFTKLISNHLLRVSHFLKFRLEKFNFLWKKTQKFVG